MIFVTGKSVTFLHASVSVARIAELGFFRHSLYSSKASGQFGAGSFVVRDAGATLYLGSPTQTNGVFGVGKSGGTCRLYVAQRHLMRPCCRTRVQGQSMSLCGQGISYFLFCFSICSFIQMQTLVRHLRFKCHDRLYTFPNLPSFIRIWEIIMQFIRTNQSW